MYLNDLILAKLLCDSGELQDRDSEFQALAAQGLKQYYYDAKKVKRSAGIKEENGVEAMSELKESEYVEVKEHMSSSLASGKVLQKKRAPTKEPESEEKKRRRDASTQRATSLRKCKSLIDNALNDLTGIESEVPKLADKGYPVQMQEWCKAKITPMRDHIEKAQLVYNEEIVKVSSDLTSPEVMESNAKKVDTALSILEVAYSDWKKTTGAEVRKLIG